MQDLHIGYANVHVTDLDRAVEFFEKALGLTRKFSDAEHGYASFEAGAIQLGVARIDASDPAQRALVGRHTGIGFVVADLVAAHAELSARGVAFPMPPEKQPWGGFMALVEDPDGNVYYLDQVGPHD